jgi:tetratricopeptide (TPR) repeat protein
MRFLNNVKELIKSHFAIGGVLLFSIILLFPVINNGWVMWDDPAYVLENKHLVINSWSDFFHQFNLVVVQGNYHPITILSLAFDYWIDGYNPTIFHTTNLIFHLFNVILTYIFVFLLFRVRSIALLVAFLFAIHPMHLESFAWVAERKDVLYVFFFLLGLISYLFYQQKKTKLNYLLCLLFFILSLLSKGMAVVFPIILLLLDYAQNRKLKRTVLIEKIPFFILSLIFGLIAIWAQDGSGAISSNADAPFIQTFLVPFYGLSAYVTKLLLPINLSALHPYPTLSNGMVSMSFLLSMIPLLVITVLVYKYFRKDRKVVFGLLFFLITIFPVLQFFSVGSAIIAERYSYLSYLGLFIALGFILKSVLQKLTEKSSNALIVLVAVYLGFLCFQTYSRIPVWKNDETLWSDVIDSYPDDYFAYMKRGSYRTKNGQIDAALADLNKSISIFKHDYYAYNNRGLIYLSTQKYTLAKQDFTQAINVDSTLYEAFLNRGLIYLNTRKYDSALVDLQKSTQLAPNNDLNYLNIALLYERMNLPEQSFTAYEKALKLNPQNHQAHYYRGLFYYKQQRYQEGLVDFTRSIDLNRTSSNSYYWKAKTLQQLSEQEQAKITLQEAVRLGYNLTEEEYSSFLE